MLTPFSGEIRDIFFFVLRLLAAAGGFLAGWFVTGPVASLLGRLAFHRPVPEWTLYWAKLAGGLLVGFLVFWYLPLGPGGGGGGSGGGTGKGIGPYTDGTGTGKITETGKGEGTGKGGLTTATDKGTERLTIELLGGDAVKEGKYYILRPKETPVDGTALKEYLEQNHHKVAGVDIVVTDRSVGESHQAYRLLLELALKYDLRPSVVTPDKKK